MHSLKVIHMGLGEANHDLHVRGSCYDWQFASLDCCNALIWVHAYRYVNGTCKTVPSSPVEIAPEVGPRCLCRADAPPTPQDAWVCVGYTILHTFRTSTYRIAYHFSSCHLNALVVTSVIHPVESGTSAAIKLCSQSSRLSKGSSTISS